MSTSRAKSAAKYSNTVSEADLEAHLSSNACDSFIQVEHEKQASRPVSEVWISCLWTFGPAKWLEYLINPQRCSHRFFFQRFQVDGFYGVATALYGR
jgi:hypothetical protein